MKRDYIVQVMKCNSDVFHAYTHTALRARRNQVVICAKKKSRTQVICYYSRQLFKNLCVDLSFFPVRVADVVAVVITRYEGPGRGLRSAAMTFDML